MKTALTQLIDKWDSEIGSYIPNAPVYKAFIEEAKCFLEKEKEQIIDAYYRGSQLSKWETGYEYYEETYNK